MRDPYVIYMCGTKDVRGYDEEKIALSYVLKNDLNIGLIECGLIDDVDEVLDKNNISLDQIVMIIGDEIKVLNEQKSQKINNISKICPIYVFSESMIHYRSDRTLFDSSNIIINESSHHDFADAFSILKELKPAYLKKEQINDIKEEMSQLKKAYFHNYLGENEDEYVLSIASDERETIFAEYLRCRLLNDGNLVKKEFDDVINKDQKPSKEVCFEFYNSNLEKIKSLDESKKNKLGERLSNKSSGGDSLGFNVHGYAIDPVTLLDLETHYLGNHRSANIYLADIVYQTRNIRDRNNLEDLSIIKHNMISGYIHFDIAGFTVPLVQILTLVRSESDLRKIGTHIISQKKFIPIDRYGHLIDENYVKTIKFE